MSVPEPEREVKGMLRWLQIELQKLKDIIGFSDFVADDDYKKRQV